MRAAEARRAVLAARSTASELGLAADDAVVLSDSNRLVVRLLPGDIVARVSAATHFGSAAREVAIVERLGDTSSPVAPLDPRVEAQVHRRDGFEISLWTYVEPVPRSVGPGEYARSLARLHAGLRLIDDTTSHVTDRIASTQRDVANRALTPDLAEADRSLLADTLRDLRRSLVARRAPEQLLHGEPHPGNVVRTEDDMVFVDFENTAVGPVEYDLAWVPDAVRASYPGADPDLVGECRGLVVAIIAMHRWRVGDEHPSGRASGVAFLDALRNGPPWPAIDEVVW